MKERFSSLSFLSPSLLGCRRRRCSSADPLDARPSCSCRWLTESLARWRRTGTRALPLSSSRRLPSSLMIMMHPLSHHDACASFPAADQSSRVEALLLLRRSCAPFFSAPPDDPLFPAPLYLFSCRSLRPLSSAARLRQQPSKRSLPFPSLLSPSISS